MATSTPRLGPRSGPDGVLVTGPSGRPVPVGRLVVLRHGETEWSRAGRHTGLTDIPLTPRGEDLARRTQPMLAGYDFALVWTSPLERARRTAELVGLKATGVDPDLVEWDYGGYEGLTREEIRERVGYAWNVWTDGVAPGEGDHASPGETVEQVAARARAVIDRALPTLEAGRDVALVAHGHLLRILTATWLRQPPRFGAQLLLDAGSVSVLSHELEQPAIMLWNATVTAG